MSVVLVPALETNAHLLKILADQGYQGTLSMRLQQAFGVTLELTKKLGHGFVAEPCSWAVE